MPEFVKTTAHMLGACAIPMGLVLVGAMGIKPPQGDILDLAITGYLDYARAGFHDQKAFDKVYGAEPSIDQLEMWDICREMSFRIAWKPYMYSQTLPHLLGGVRAPALVVWGDDDKIVPISALPALISTPSHPDCAARFAAAMKPAMTASMSEPSIHLGTSRVFTSGTRLGAHNSRWL